MARVPDPRPEPKQDEPLRTSLGDLLRAKGKVPPKEDPDGSR
jgi:hypothetical protein